MKEITCQKCRKLLSLYIDSALNPDENGTVEAHLQKCGQCAEEWRLLDRTIHLLHAMPKAKAPPSLVHDIHLKLEEINRAPFGFGNRLDLIRDLLIALPLKKASYGAVSLILVGVVTAVLIQNIPLFTDRTRLAEKQKGIGSIQEETTLLAQNDETEPKDYYPDIPHLSEYEPGRIQAYSYNYNTPDLLDKKNNPTVVDFVTTGNYYRKNRTDSFFSAGIPAIMNNKKEPDLRIMFFPQNEKEKKLQMYKLIHSSAWMTRDRMKNNTLLLLVPAENLDELASLCSRYKGYSFQSLWSISPHAGKYQLVSVHWH